MRDIILIYQYCKIQEVVVDLLSPPSESTGEKEANGYIVSF